jgi:hypothetical protein
MTNSPLTNCLTALKIAHQMGSPRAILLAEREIGNYMKLAGSDLAGRKAAAASLREAWSQIGRAPDDPALVWDRIAKIERDLEYEAENHQ